MKRLILLCFLAPSARASVFDTYGFGARAAAMANAHVAAADDYTAVYYNPGALTVHKIPQTAVGVQVVVPALRIEGRFGPDDPAPVEPSTNVGVHLGLLFPLGGLIENRFALGVGLYLPTIQVTRVESFDPSTPHFYRYGALPDKINVALAAAFELHETVSIGLGYQYLGRLDGDARIELDLLNRRFSRKDVAVDIQGVGGLTAGVHIRPSPAWAIGLSYRAPLSIAYDLRVDILLKDVGLLAVDIDGIALYTPPQYSLGVAWKHPQVTLTADLVWSRWSEAPDPSPHFDITLDGGPVGLDPIAASGAPVDLAAQDTLSPHVGVEWAPTENTRLRAGWALRPTPLPAQTGFGNYLDGDAHLLGLGASLRFADPLEVHQAPITLDLTTQLTAMPARSHKKTSPEAGPDLESSGHVWHVALTFRHDF